MEQRRRIGIGLGVLALVAVSAAHRPAADIRVDIPAVSDPAVPRAQAAVRLGMLGVSVLVTWGAGQLR